MMVLVSPKENEKMEFIGFKKSMNYEKLFELTNISGEMLLIIWTTSYTKATSFVWMAIFQSLFIKKRPISLFTSLFALSISSIPSRILFEVN